MDDGDGPARSGATGDPVRRGERRVTRRETLQAGAAVGLGGGVLSGGWSLANTPPKLAYGFFNVPDTEAEVADLKFALVTDGQLSSTDEQQAVVDALDVSNAGLNPSPRFRQGTAVQFFDRFDADNVDSSVKSDLTSDQQSTLDQQFAGGPSLTEALPSGRTVKGVVEDAVRLPPESRRFTGEATEFPSIGYGGSYVGESPDDPRRRFHAQLHDGFIYQFPRENLSFPRDHRYDLRNLGSNTPQVNALPDGTGRFTVDIHTDGDWGGNVVPRITHRAHPMLATLRALAKRRSIVLGITAAMIDQETTTLGEYTDQVLGLTKDTTLSVAGTLGPAQSEPTLEGVSFAVAKGLAPLAAAVGAAALGVAVAPAALAVEIVILAGAVKSAIEDLSEWGETISDADDAVQDVITDTSEIADLIWDPACPEDDDSPKCGPAPGSSIDIDNTEESTVVAISELSRFAAYYGGPSLAAGTHQDTPFDDNLQTYRAISDEIRGQASLMGTTLDEATLKPELDTRFGGVIESVETTMHDREQRLLDRVEADFKSPVALPTFATGPTDPDGDDSYDSGDRYEDVNGDGRADVNDVQALLSNLDEKIVQDHPEAFNFSSESPDDEVTTADVVALYERVTE